jgi:hypothetical protein
MGWRALKKEDQQVFDKLFEKARLHAEAGGLTGRPWPFESILISILLEQEEGIGWLEIESRGSRKVGWMGGRVDFKRVCGVFLL